MNIKFFKNKWKEILIYKITCKKYYICDGCKHIHKRENDDLELNSEYGIFVSNICAGNIITETRGLLMNAILNR